MLNQPLVCLMSEPRVNASVTVNTSSKVQASPAVSTQPTEKPVVPIADSQASLLALLTQAAGQQIVCVPLSPSLLENGLSVLSRQTTANTVASPTTSADPTQLLLQYLQSASVNSTAANQLSPTTSQPVSDAPVSQVSTDPRMSKPSVKPSVAPHTEPIRGRQSPRHGNYRSPHRDEYHHERGYNNRPYARSDPKGVPRRRGRWNRWDERESDSQRDANGTRWSPRRGSSRSRSPENRSSWRKSPTFSPPRRRSLSPRTRYTVSSPTSGKDEFGRDLRPLSPPKSPTSNTDHSAKTHPVIPSTLHDTKAEFPSTSTSNDPMSRSSSIAANTFSKGPSASDQSVELNNKTTPRPGPDNDNIDISAFDPTSPASWEALGKMWEGMNGYTPSTEELMQFMMMSTINSATQSRDWQLQNAIGENEHRNSYGGGVPRDEEGFYGNSRNNNDHGWTNGGGQLTLPDAVELGGDELGAQAATDIEQSQLTNSESRSGGKMQKMGDRWMFVRNEGAV